VGWPRALKIFAICSRSIGRILFIVNRLLTITHLHVPVNPKKKLSRPKKSGTTVVLQGSGPDGGHVIAGQI
jgi:hypothetical protein